MIYTQIFSKKLRVELFAFKGNNMFLTATFLRN